MAFQVIMFHRPIWLCIILLSGSAFAADVPFVFEENSSGVAAYSSAQLEQAYAASPDLKGVPFASTPSNDDVLEFPVAGGSVSPVSKTEKRAEEINKTLNARVEPDNTRVHDLALALAAEHSGDYTVDQVCEIYSYLKYGNSTKKPWSYARDPRGVDYFNFASKSLSAGDDAKCAGAGDCDDFAILMSSLVESIGGTTRIILARNNSTGGHAYAEVYIGQLSDPNSQVEEIIKWLQEEYDTEKIFTHIETDAKDVWLNLDWGNDAKGNAHPGGPFFQGDRHYVLCIRDMYGKTSVKPPEKDNKPPKLFGMTADRSGPQEAGAVITWTAEARDADNDSVLYRFFLNDDPETKWAKENHWVWTTTEDDLGESQIEVQVRDGLHAGPDKYDGNKVASFTINEPEPAPVAVTEVANRPPALTSLNSDKFSPQDAGNVITWTAEANDPENDPISYQFLLNGQKLTDWQSQGQWTWTTTDANVGDNKIEVRVRDVKHAGPEKYDARSLKSFTINAPNPVPAAAEEATNQPPVPETPEEETKQGATKTLPLQGGDESVTVVLFGATRTPLEDENAQQEILKVDVGLLGAENATYQLIDADNNIYSPGLYKPLSSGKQLVYFLVPEDCLFKRIIVTPAGGKPIYINWWATPKGSNDNLIVSYYGITDCLINPDEQGIVVQVRVQNNGTKNLYVNPENFTLLDQWGWPYRPTLGFNPEIVEPQNATSRVLLGFTGISPISSPGALVYDFGMLDQIIIEEETTQGGIRALPLQGSDENATVVLFGATRNTLEDENTTQEILKVDVGLLGAENATYQLVDADDNIYLPDLYKPLSSGKQLVYFLVPKDSLFKLLNVTPLEGAPIYINWWVTPKGSNENLVLRYYGISDWVFNPDEQMIVVQVRVQNNGTQNIIVSPENFTLLDQWHWPYRPTLGFDAEIVGPQNATDRLLLGFTGVSLISCPAALAYDYGASNQIIIDFVSDYVPLSDELVYGAMPQRAGPR